QLGAGGAERIQVHARGSRDDLLTGRAVQVGHGGPGQELEIVDRLREARAKLAPTRHTPGCEEVLAGGLVVGEGNVERPTEPGGGGYEAQPGSVQVGERRQADRGDQWVVR